MNRHLKTIIGIGLSLLLLAWALRDVSPGEVWRELRGADLVLLTASVLVNLASLAIRAVRWGLLLHPVAPSVPFRARFASVVIGFAANNVLPARVGEFARALTLSRVAPVTVGAAFATLVVERIFDAMILVAMLFGVMAMADFPTVGDIGGVSPRAAGITVAALMGAAGAVLLAMVVVPRPFVRVAETMAGPLPRWAGRPLLAALHSFLAGLAVLRSAKLFALSAGLAGFQWWFTAWSYLLGFRAFGITEVPFAGAVFLQALIALAVAVPSSPGFFGPFEAATKLGLGLWAVSPEKAVSFAVGIHLGGFIPVTLMGVYYVARLKLTWSEVKHSEEVVEESAEEPAPSTEPAREGAR